MPENDTTMEEEQNSSAQPAPEAGDTAAAQKTEDVFTFRRMSGLDQAILQTDWEWRNLASLDQKLWMAMSCPTHGLEFDTRTLELLDPDKDGRIRSADILAAVAWVCDRVQHPAKLRDGGEAMPLDNLRDDTDAGKELLAAAKLALEKSGAADAQEVTPAQIEAVLAEAEGYAFNGDGIVPVSSVPEEDKDVAEYVRAALAVVGARKDASGKPGLDAELADEFAKRLEATRDFRVRVAGAALPLGEATAAAWTLLTRLGPKIDDYFNRCRMADFAPGTLAALNEDTALANAGLGSDGISPDQNGELIKENLAATLVRMPLARVEARKPLPLNQGLNPAWLADVKEFCSLLAPLLSKGGQTDALTEEEWAKIKAGFASYAGALESKPVYDLPPADASRLELPDLAPLAFAPADDPLKRVWMPVTPNENLDKLDDAQIARFLDAATRTAFADLAQKDLAAPKMAAIQDLDKLALFHAHLYTLLMNFVSFIDFYEPSKRAIFQSGTLYLDSRECRLCVPVGDLETHVRLAAQSHLCLIYCDIRRTEQDGAVSTGSISAALTAGDLAALIDGRHGLFIDNHGKEWDSVITKVVHNPISLREAVWAPYIRISNLISEQVQKFLAAKEEGVSKASAEAVGTAAAKPAEAKPPFDFAKGAGIFAAVSVALSVLSAAFAYIANSLASLGWWWPLALVGVFICISGPSVVIAWFKLRRRSLGPLLDASGWAVNQGAPINLVMGQTLTSVGKMPPHARRNMDDPYRLTARMRKTRNRIKFWFWFLFILALAIGTFALYCHWFGLPAWLTGLLAHKPA
ncbi:MAG: ABC transporter permease [Desulfovibrio sp.]|uniref:ABC transporter permease n=1 Tax=Desulfovibrio sp. TaxID=885 RepID=UPI001A7DBB78|nr:ABC transporter permease [Desulfovibrio sp.]MBD5417516.1 ABC transporter permease [Desulfovibrio sp.]